MTVKLIDYNSVIQLTSGKIGQKLIQLKMSSMNHFLCKVMYNYLLLTPQNINGNKQTF